VRGLRSLLVATDRGFDPIGVVMGAGVFRIWRPTVCSSPLGRAQQPLVYTAYEDSLREAWGIVVARLQSEAAQVGAHGVLGVSVSQMWLSENRMVQIQLVGTAVRVAGIPPLARPFLSNLATEDFLKLLVGGWVPCGLAWGVAAVHVHGYDMSTVLQRTTFINAEMQVASEAMGLTKARLEAQARSSLAQVRADGAVQIRVEMEKRPQTCGGGAGILVDGLILGTGVVRYGPPLAPPSTARNLRRERRERSER
jgi:uncharacterized protein YbjQ (UPF0145 family)